MESKMDKSGVDDLVLLEDVSEESIQSHLRHRFKKDKIYTYIGPVLLSCNPFREIRRLYTVTCTLPSPYAFRTLCWSASSKERGGRPPVSLHRCSGRAHSSGALVPAIRVPAQPVLRREACPPGPVSTAWLPPTPTPHTHTRARVRTHPHHLSRVSVTAPAPPACSARPAVRGDGARATRGCCAASASACSSSTCAAATLSSRCTASYTRRPSYATRSARTTE